MLGSLLPSSHTPVFRGALSLRNLLSPMQSFYLLPQFWTSCCLHLPHLLHLAIRNLVFLDAQYCRSSFCDDFLFFSRHVTFIVSKQMLCSAGIGVSAASTVCGIAPGGGTYPLASFRLCLLVTALCFCRFGLPSIIFSLVCLCLSAGWFGS